MSIIKAIKKNKLLFVVVLAYIFLMIAMPQKALESGKNSMYYVKEMLQIMPVIFILTSLIEAWVPRETIMKGFGEGSGFKGSIFSFILGSFSAGPIYAAFPVCKILLKKGASVSNIVIILSAWAVVKVPMLLNESKFLGPRFMAIRWVLTTISIFIMAYIISAIVKKDTIPYDVDNIEGGPIKKDTINIKEQIASVVNMHETIPDNFELVNKARVTQKQIKGDIKDNIRNAIEMPGKSDLY